MCTNFTDFLYFGSDEIYSNCAHFLTCLEIIVHSFGAYIIIMKTPKKMSNMKMIMLTLHLVGAFLDFYLSFIAIPVLTLPMCAGYPLGISLILGIPTPFQVYLGVSMVSVIKTTILMFFEDRYHRLVHGRLVELGIAWKRNVYITANYILAFIFILPGYLAIPEQSLGREAIQQKIPCLPVDVLSRPGFFVLAIDNSIPGYCLLFENTLALSQQSFFVFSIFRFLSKSVRLSEQTTRLHKQFIVALCIQVSLPLTVVVLPVTYISFSMWSGYYNQAANNLTMFVIATHGVLSTLTMLTVHKAYRKEVKSIFLGKTPTPSDQSQIFHSRCAPSAPSQLISVG